MRDNKQPKSIHEQIERFEKDNPALSDAMRLFGVTMAQYQGSLNTMNGPHIYQSDNTAPKREINYGNSK